MPAEIDLDRLFRVLDLGKDAQSKARGMADEAEEVREALRKAKLGAEVGRVMEHRKAERDPATVARIAALEDQRLRLEARRQELLPIMNQRVSLARECLRYARQQRVEVGPLYDF